MLDLAEKELLPLFKADENGVINFLVVSHDSLGYQAEELIRRGYTRDEAGDYDNVALPQQTNYVIELPKGFNQVFGENYPDIVKMRACHYGFHPEDDDDNLYKEYAEGGLSYQARKKSQFYSDSFESLIVTGDGDVSSYSFCYVDKNTNTALVEPVSTREKYRKKGLCKQMLHGLINRLKEMGIERAYINSYDWRKKVYNSAGFATEDSIGFWYKKIEM
jgi:N-acetylglutamate synthase-like GNAT family acetyltransferase